MSILLFYLTIERQYLKLYSSTNLLFCQGAFLQIFVEIVRPDVFHLYFFVLQGIPDIQVSDRTLISFSTLYWNTSKKYYKFLIHNSVPAILIPILILHHTYPRFGHLKHFSLQLPYHYQSYDYKNDRNLGICYRYFCYFYLFVLFFLLYLLFLLSLYLHLSPNQIEFMKYLALILKNLHNSYLFYKFDFVMYYFVDLKLGIFLHFVNLISLLTHNTLIIIILLLHYYDS